MTVLDLYLVRHGQSYGNIPVNGLPIEQVPVQERPPGCQTDRMEDDWCLSPLGQQQANALGERLAAIQFDTIYCSPLERARATARAVVKHQPRPVELRVVRDMLEIGDYGEETPEEIHGRALRAARALRGDAPPGARVLVVAHAAFNNRLLTALLGLPGPDHLFRFGQDNTGLSRIIFSSEDVPRFKRVRLYCLNDLSHLTPELHAQTVANNMWALYGGHHGST